MKYHDSRCESILHVMSHTKTSRFHESSSTSIYAVDKLLRSVNSQLTTETKWASTALRGAPSHANYLGLNI